MTKKIISFLCVLTIIFSFFSFCFPASASADNTGFVIYDLWDHIFETDSGLSIPFINHLDPEFNISSGCSQNNGGAHNWVYSPSSALTPVVGHYRCSYCGIDRADYVQDAYTDALAENNLTNTGYDSTGGFIWYPSFDDFKFYRFYYAYSYRFTHPSNYGGTTYQVSNRSIRYEYNLIPTTGYCAGFEGNIYAPISGQYTILPVNLSYGLLNNNNVSWDYNNNALGYKSSGFEISISDKKAIKQLSEYYTGYQYFFLPAFRIIPSDWNSAPPSQTFYTSINNINTTSYNLATVDNSQNITNVYENTTVINNSNTTFTMPGGSSYPIDSWDFDFSCNKYRLIVLDGELEIPVTLEFGVDDLNITFDGDEYNYKYATEAAPHTHTWELTSTVDPTCTSSGSKTYTCSICNDVRNEVVQALDHDWMFTGTVEGYYYADLGSCVCPECNSTNVSLAGGGENHFSSDQIGVVCDDCGEEWTVTGSYVAAYDTYVCSRCQETKQLPAGDDLDNSDSGYWAWLRIWLNYFKTWLGEKLDELINKDSGGSDVIIDPDFTIVLPSADPGIQYEDENGDVQVWHPSDLLAKFAFWRDVRDIGTELYASVQPTRSGAAPELIVHLGAANSPFGFQYGGDVIALDLSWYSDYKETVDSITGGFLWLLYLYGIWKHLPEIISGAGMMDNRIQDIESGTKGGRGRKH